MGVGLSAQASDNRSFMGLDALWQAVWRIEQQLGLLDRTIAGVHFWPVLRTRFVDLLSNRLSGLELVLPRLRATTANRAITLVAPLMRDRHRAPGAASGTFDTILFPFARKHPWDGALVDIYSSRVPTEAGIGSVLVVDDDLPRAQWAAGATVCSKDHYLALAVARAAFRVPTLMLAVRRQCRDLDDAVRRELGIENPLSATHFAARLAVFMESRHVAARFIAKAKPKRVVFVSSTGARAFCAAANDLGIPSIELQHGVISPFHAPYHFPGRPVVAYAPDVFLTFGRFWTETTELPGNTRAAVIGCSYLQDYAQRAAAPKRRQVFVVSQGTVARRLAALVQEIARLAPDWTFIYRAHPVQASTEGMGEFPPNVRFAQPPADPYEPLLESDVQMGVYSTLLFEGMALGARTIVLDLPGAEHMRPVIARGDAVLARTAQDAVACLQTAPKSASNDSYYAPPAPSLLDAIAAAV
jgi:hypothetical protein